MQLCMLPKQKKKKQLGQGLGRRAREPHVGVLLIFDPIYLSFSRSLRRLSPEMPGLADTVLPRNSQHEPLNVALL